MFRRSGLVALIGAVIAGAAVIGAAFAMQLGSGVDTYTGCMSSSGDLAKFAKGGAPAKACTGSQTQISFSGPLPSCAEGNVLAWQSGGWTCGTVARPDEFEFVRHAQGLMPPDSSFVRLASLSLQPGLYAVTGRLELESAGTAADPPVDVRCWLIPSNEDGTPGTTAGSGNDVASVRLAPLDSPGSTEEVALFVSQRLSQPGSVVLGCSASGNTVGAFARAVAVRALQLGSITTQPAPGPLP